MVALCEGDFTEENITAITLDIANRSKHLFTTIGGNHRL